MLKKYNLELVGWKTDSEFINTWNYVYSENFDVAAIGCATLRLWMTKQSTSINIEVTEALKSCLISIASNDRSKNDIIQRAIKKLKLFYEKKKSQIEADDNDLKELLEKYYTSSTKFEISELIKDMRRTLEYLNVHFWQVMIKNINDSQEEVFKLFKDYIKGENKKILIKTKSYIKRLIKYLIPKIVEELSTKDTIFDVPIDDKFQTLFLEYIENLVSYDNCFATMLSLEFATYLIRGSQKASAWLDILIKNKYCDLPEVIKFVQYSTTFDPIAATFLLDHDSQPSHSDEWPVTSVGFFPQSDPNDLVRNMDQIEIVNPIDHYISDERIESLESIMQMRNKNGGNKANNQNGNKQSNTNNERSYKKEPYQQREPRKPETDNTHKAPIVTEFIPIQRPAKGAKLEVKLAENKESSFNPTPAHVERSKQKQPQQPKVIDLDRFYEDFEDNEEDDVPTSYRGRGGGYRGRGRGGRSRGKVSNVNVDPTGQTWNAPSFKRRQPSPPPIDGAPKKQYKKKENNRPLPKVDPTYQPIAAPVNPGISQEPSFKLNPLLIVQRKE